MQKMRLVGKPLLGRGDGHGMEAIGGRVGGHERPYKHRYTCICRVRMGMGHMIAWA